jgi:hypothetical protein
MAQRLSAKDWARLRNASAEELSRGVVNVHSHSNDHDDDDEPEENDDEENATTKSSSETKLSMGFRKWLIDTFSESDNRWGEFVQSSVLHNKDWPADTADKSVYLYHLKSNNASPEIINSFSRLFARYNEALKLLAKKTVPLSHKRKVVVDSSSSSSSSSSDQSKDKDMHEKEDLSQPKSKRVKQESPPKQSNLVGTSNKKTTTPEPMLMSQALHCSLVPNTDFSFTFLPKDQSWTMAHYASLLRVFQEMIDTNSDLQENQKQERDQKEQREQTNMPSLFVSASDSGIQWPETSSSNKFNMIAQQKHRPFLKKDYHFKRELHFTDIQIPSEWNIQTENLLKSKYLHNPLWKPNKNGIRCYARYGVSHSFMLAVLHILEQQGHQILSLNVFFERIVG